MPTHDHLRVEHVCVKNSTQATCSLISHHLITVTESCTTLPACDCAQNPSSMVPIYVPLASVQQPFDHGYATQLGSASICEVVLQCCGMCRRREWQPSSFRQISHANHSPRSALSRAQEDTYAVHIYDRCTLWLPKISLKLDQLRLNSECLRSETMSRGSTYVKVDPCVQNWR